MLELPKHLLRKSRQQDAGLRGRESVLNVLFVVTFSILVLSALAICLVYLTGTNRLVLHRLAAVFIAIGIIGSLYICLRRRLYFVAASGLLSIYWLLATIMAISWGVTLPVVLLVYCALIVLSGIVLGAGYAIITLFASSLALFIIQLAIVRGNLHPNFYWQTEAPKLSDLAVYYFVFAVVGVSSWLFNRQTDRSLQHALRAEAALQREKDLLELKVVRRTRELQAAQIDKMQQMYRFAQLGQFSTSLLHDIGNHMTTLSIDVEGMGDQQPKSPVQRRIKQRLNYVDKMVQLAYEHINGKEQARDFNVVSEIREITKILQYDARAAHVRLHDPERPDTPVTLHGDPARFRQLIANLVNNAIAAHPAEDTSMEGRDVWVRVESGAAGAVVIIVEDTGKGIPADKQKKIFDPFYTTKQSGTGIGLFIVQQVVEGHFGGKVELTSKPGKTSFKVTLHAAADA